MGRCKRWVKILTLLLLVEDERQECFVNSRKKHRNLFISAYVRVQSASNLSVFLHPARLPKGDRLSVQRLQESRWPYQQANQPAPLPTTFMKSLATAPCKYSLQYINIIDSDRSHDSLCRDTTSSSQCQKKLFITKGCFFSCMGFSNIWKINRRSL